MPTKDSVCKAARIRKEDWQKLKRIMPSTFGEWVHQTLNETRAETDLAEIFSLFDLTLEDGLGMVRDGLENGRLMISDGKIIGINEVDLSVFLEVCKEKRLDPQEMIERTIANILSDNYM